MKNILFQFIQRTYLRVKRLWCRLVLRDQMLLAAQRWFREDGDNILRYAYPLDNASIVIDVGGYKGDFAAEAVSRFGCQVHLFEPYLPFYESCRERFANDVRVQSHAFGLARQSGSMLLTFADEGTSFKNQSLNSQQRPILAQLSGVDQVLNDLNLTDISLIKINIEGGEYELLETLIECGWIARIQYLQIQFHDFIPNAYLLRDQIREKLKLTHTEMWCYPFIWESWIKTPASSN